MADSEKSSNGANGVSNVGTGFFSALGKFILGLVFLVTAVLASVALYYYVQEKRSDTEMTLYETDEYHIVFLENSLFYFCKISDYNSEYIECREPYYLVKKNEEQEDGSYEEKVYVKRPAEEEVYKPDGSFYLKKDQISYIAKLAADSPVLEYIQGSAEVIEVSAE